MATLPPSRLILSVLIWAKAAPYLITYSLNPQEMLDFSLSGNFVVPQEMLNFGLVPSDSGPRTMDLLVLNSGTRPVTLTSLVATPVTDALAVEFSSIKVGCLLSVSSALFKLPVINEP